MEYEARIPRTGDLGFNTSLPDAIVCPQLEEVVDLSC